MVNKNYRNLVGYISGGISLTASAGSIPLLMNERPINAGLSYFTALVCLSIFGINEIARLKDNKLENIIK